MRDRPSARRLPRLAILLGAALFAAAACGTTSTSSSPAAVASGPPAQSAGPAESPTPSAAPTPSDATLRVGWSSEPDTMNPLTTYSTEADEVLHLVYDTLLGYDLELKPTPELASSFEASPDGKTFTFHLRPNATWSDGKPLTSADVKYTFETIHKESLGQYAQWLTHLVGVETPDPATAVVTFDAAQAFNPGLIVPILPQHIWGSMSAEADPDVRQRHPGRERSVHAPGVEEGRDRSPSTGAPRSGATRPSRQASSTSSMPTRMSWPRPSRAARSTSSPRCRPRSGTASTAPRTSRHCRCPSWSFHHIGFNVSDAKRVQGQPAAQGQDDPPGPELRPRSQPAGRARPGRARQGWQLAHPAWAWPTGTGSRPPTRS